MNERTSSTRVSILFVVMSVGQWTHDGDVYKGWELKLRQQRNSIAIDILILMMVSSNAVAVITSISIYLKQ